MEKILISACLLGEKCTYKGGDNRVSYIEELNRYYDLVPFCPEVEGGLPTPRKPSEIRGSSVYHDDGKDVTKAFHDGAYKATAICSYLGIRIAILKEYSPSCGTHQVHDGYFRHRLIDGEGVTAAALRRMGVRVYNEEEGLALLQDVQKQEQIKDEKTRVALAKENQEPKKERLDLRSSHPLPGKSYQGRTKPFTKQGSSKPFPKQGGKKKPFRKPFKKKD